MEGLPEGLTAKLQRVNDTRLTLSFEGKAISNDQNINLYVIFKNGMLSSGELYDCKLPVTLECRASYAIKMLVVKMFVYLRLMVGSFFSWIPDMNIRTLV